jgi:ABC-type Fe3+/spermidine/putrescine transport system ATPase subunit
MSDYLAVMNEGRIEQIGEPRAIYDRPQTEFVAGFLGVSNFIDAVVIGRDQGNTIVESAGERFGIQGAERAPGSRVRLTLRPERVRLTDRGRLHATVVEVIYRGAQTHVYMDRAGAQFVAFLQNAGANGRSFEPGQKIACDWEDGSLVVVG